jgi:sodium transport system ATP-binding protein
MVQVENIHKSFKTQEKQKRVTKEILKGVSFIAEPGKIFGLLGPNGAGKTTTLRIIATLFKADQGMVQVLGKDVRKEPRLVRQSIGFLTSDMKLNGNLTPRNLIQFYGQLNHIDSRTIEQRMVRLAEYLDMKSFLDKPVDKLSTGMSQKASIAISLIHDPQVIIFDEPTNGLDILAAKTVVDFLRDYRSQGKTVIVSTHIMSEAEKLCDSVGIMLDGEIACHGTQESLKTQFQQPTLEDVFFTVAKSKGALTNG